MAGNVCVSAVVPYRSRVLSHETIALNEDKTLNQLVTAPLQKHFVSNMCPFHPRCKLVFQLSSGGHVIEWIVTEHGRPFLIRLFFVHGALYI